MRSHKSALLLASIADVLAMAVKMPGGKVLTDIADDPPPRPKAPPREATEQGKRQGERLARQKLDYSASDRCIARIRERHAQFHSEEKP